MSRNQPADLVNVDFWADRIAAVIKLAEHYGMTVEIAGGELVVSRRVSDEFTASTEVRWQAAPPPTVPVQPAADDTSKEAEDIVAPHCDRFPIACPNLVTVPPAPPHHDGGFRCGCYDEEPQS